MGFVFLFFFLGRGLLMFSEIVIDRERVRSRMRTVVRLKWVAILVIRLRKSIYLRIANRCVFVLYEAAIGRDMTVKAYKST